MNNLLTKRCCIIDRGGLFVSWGHRLAREFGEVFYHNPAWKTLSPRSRELFVGEGFDDITMLPNFWDHASQMDIFVFPTVGDGDWQLELVRQGKRVWGSRKAEGLELYRDSAKREFHNLGMPVGDYDVVIGLDNLRTYLKRNPNVHVKINLTRGDGETFKSPSYEQIKSRLYGIYHDLDDVADIMPFICERPIDPALEIGIDTHCVDGEFPGWAINGVEKKDESYCGSFMRYDDLDEDVRKVNTWLQPALRRYNYRGFISTEIRVGEDEQPYLIDITCRAPSPPSECIQEAIENWGEIIWHGAAGVMVDPVAVAKYCSQAVIYADHADEEWMTVDIPEKIRNFVKLYFHCRINGRDKVAPQPAKFSQIGWVVGLGNTLKEANEQCELHAEMISGDKIEVKTDTLEKVIEEIRKGEELGVSFSDDPIKV
jgi:hypothetical protein